MYSYGQFVKTSAGRMRVRKAKTSRTCKKCFFNVNNECTFGKWKCYDTMPEDAYFEKPSVGGKDRTSN